jgi:hypothetical protein
VDVSKLHCVWPSSDSKDGKTEAEKPQLKHETHSSAHKVTQHNNGPTKQLPSLDYTATNSLNYFHILNLAVSPEERMVDQAERQDSERDDVYFDHDDPDDFVASSKPSGAKGNAKGSNKNKNSSGNIYSVKHNRIKEAQREMLLCIHRKSKGCEN